jgi:hypothetical protein
MINHNHQRHEIALINEIARLDMELEEARDFIRNLQERLAAEHKQCEHWRLLAANAWLLPPSQHQH